MAGEFSGPINRAPAGLLGFLGLKNLGQNPDLLSGVLQTTWDTSRLYLASPRQYRVDYVNGNDVGVWFFPNLATATGTNWAWVERLTCTLFLDVDDDEVAYTPCMKVEGNADQIFVLSDTSPLVVRAPGYGKRRSYNINVDQFWVPPNSNIGVIINAKKTDPPVEVGFACAIWYALLPS